MSTEKEYYKIVSDTIISELNKRNMAGYYCENKEEALKKALEIIKENSSVSWGGSQSISEIGLIEALKNGNYTVYDRADGKTDEEKEDIIRKAYFCDYYLGSTNAITLDGKLVNIDGNGNRISAYIYGPKNVVLIVGANKIAENVENAISRVKNHASVLNSIRLKRNTPCAEKGYCYSCKSNETICCHTVVTRYSKPKDRIKIILVGEELGY